MIKATKIAVQKAPARYTKTQLKYMYKRAGRGVRCVSYTSWNVIGSSLLHLMFLVDVIMVCLMLLLAVRRVKRRLTHMMLRWRRVRWVLVQLVQIQLI